MPVGFKWFVPGLFDGSYCFGGEESAGASFLRLDGTVWTTDKDGPIMDLLAAEITARTGKDPGEHYRELNGEVRYSLLHSHRRAGRRRSRKQRLQRLSPDAVKESNLAGEPIIAKLTRAPGNRRSHRRSQSRRRRAAGLRPGLPVRRTFTRSMRRASRARLIWTPS